MATSFAFVVPNPSSAAAWPRNGALVAVPTQALGLSLSSRAAATLLPANAPAPFSGMGVAVLGGRAAQALVRVQCTAGGDGHDDGEEPPKRFECETFLLDLNKEEAKYSPIALFGSADLLKGYASTAQDSENLLLNILAGVPTNRLRNEGFVQLFTRAEAMEIGMAFPKVKAECIEGYVRADSLVAAMDALSLMAQKVPGPKNKQLPAYPILVPSSEDVDRGLYFQDLMYAFDALLWLWSGCSEALMGRPSSRSDSALLTVSIMLSIF